MLEKQKEIKELKNNRLKISKKKKTICNNWLKQEINRKTKYSKSDGSRKLYN